MEQLLGAYDRSPEPIVREAIALILGSAPDPPAAALLARWPNEAAPEAREECMVALTKLGIAEAKDAFIESLRSSSGKTRLRLLNHGTFWWAFCHTTKSSNLVAGILILTPEF